QRLFTNAKLDDGYVWLERTGRDATERVVSVNDGLVRMGPEDNGYLATREEYRDFHLSLEFRWGELKTPSKYVRNSGLLLHGHGPDGAAGGRWISSIECQLAQGCEGDFILIRGRDDQGKAIDGAFAAYVEVGSDKRPRWNPDAGKLTQYSGRQFWWNKHEVGFEELIDTRGKDDVASPLGEWTRVEAICAADRVTIKINGTTVNECVAASPAAGKIALQGEGYEVFFRNVEIRPLGAADRTPDQANR
ncbi:MAG: DUF1080 domain-containing protein, partial [Planctomycetales bacterium]|nr:DUF1080 domain-containing protein [Planctomycetales bacterium]